MDVRSSYGLFPFKGWKGKSRDAKYDISTVFVYAAFDRYLKENGKLAFLITQSVFQQMQGMVEEYRCVCGIAGST